MSQEANAEPVICENAYSDCVEGWIGEDGVYRERIIKAADIKAAAERVRSRDASVSTPAGSLVPPRK